MYFHQIWIGESLGVFLTHSLSNDDVFSFLSREGSSDFFTFLAVSGIGVIQKMLVFCGDRMDTKSTSGGYLVMQGLRSWFPRAWGF